LAPARRRVSPPVSAIEEAQVVKVTLVPSSVSGSEGAQNQYLTSFLINDTIAVDAGSLGFFGTPQQQEKVKHVLITHTHIDHTASLAIFIENAYLPTLDCPIVYGSDEVLDCIQRDIFNDRIWPDFLKLSQLTPKAPFLKLQRIEANQPIEIDGLRLTPIGVDHVVPTLGLVIEDPARKTAVVIASDTGPTDAIWRKTNATPNIKAVFLEAAFPNNMKWLADASKHLTPAMFAAEAAKLAARPRLLAVHIKARYLEEISRELAALGLPNVEICHPGQTYEF
jgi:ribonuclease BN (tRNA processing enzyme)